MYKPYFKKIGFAGVVATIFVAEAIFAAPMVFRASGASADLAGTVSDFQTALGNPNNRNAPGPINDGRRQINWDAGIVPFDMPPDFFNNPAFPPTRGAVFSTPGSGFGVSNSVSPADNEFDSINATYPDQFETFSAPRLFSAIDSNVVDVNFFVPATNTAATVSGFGAIFTDVDLADSTKIEFFDPRHNLLLTEYVDPDPQQLSFLGVTFDSGLIGSVRITSGNSILGPNDNPSQGIDIVVMDDLLYSEPQAISEPGILFLLMSGFTGMVFWRRNRKIL